jgi:hypothetical protein
METMPEGGSHYCGPLEATQRVSDAQGAEPDDVEGPPSGSDSLRWRGQLVLAVPAQGPSSDDSVAAIELCKQASFTLASRPDDVGVRSSRGGFGHAASLRQQSLRWGREPPCQAGDGRRAACHGRTREVLAQRNAGAMLRAATCGTSSAGRAQASQAWGREFEPRVPLR